MKNRKNGVAVIIVLGLLALLMVLGVTFSISMRVERAGSANYASAVKNRQMLWAGLAQAIGDINHTIGTDMFPAGDYLVSGASDWGSNVVNGVKLLKCPSVTNELPGVLGGYANQLRAAWTPIGGTGSDGREGYVAYAVLNLSDMLDLHHVGGAARSGGLDASEMVLVPGILPNAANMTALVTARTTDGPFETLGDFRSLYPDIPSTYFIDYSRYLQDANRTNAVYIGGDENSLNANRAAIIARLTLPLNQGGLGVPVASAGGVFSNLLDYVDADSMPRNPNGPGVEAVPMLNEVASITNLVSLIPGPGDRLAVFVKAGIETWYPFVKKSNSGPDFSLNCNSTLSLVVTANNGNGVVQLASVSTNLSLVKQPITYKLSSPFPNIPLSTGIVVSGVSVTNMNTLVTLSWSISNLTVTIDGSDDVVDQVGGAFTFSAAGQPNNTFPKLMSPVTYQTADPRFNWTLGTVPFKQWFNHLPASTIGTTNDMTQLFLTNATVGVVSSDRFHCSDSGFLYSPLEFGNIPHSIDSSSILQTFRVFKHSNNHPRHLILENFRTESNTVSRGLVNANTLDSTILAATFRDMPYPYVGAAATVPSNTLNSIQQLFASAQSSGIVFQAVSDVLDMDWRGNFPDLSDVEREALAAYSTGLLGVRQNVFLIVVAASGASQGMGTGSQSTVETQSAQRALAVVWRDPVKNSAGQYDCFLRMFKWLD